MSGYASPSELFATTSMRCSMIDTLGLCPKPRTRREAGVGDDTPLPNPCLKRIWLTGRQEAFAAETREKKSLSHLFHGPLDPLPAITAHPLPDEAKTTKESIQEVGGEGNSHRFHHRGCLTKP